MAETRNTRVSMLSACSQRVLADVGMRSKTRLFQMQNKEINDATFNQSWDSFGKFISSKLRQGRGVKVPGFGVFTFSAPFVRLNGVTNPKIRDKGNREPVFLISPQFFRGGRLKTGRYCRKFRLIRPYNAKGVNGAMHLTKCNFTQIGMLAGVSKDEARTSIERIIKQLADDVRRRGACEMIIPTVGVFSVKNKLSAVAFDDGLYLDAHDITNKNFTPNQRKQFSNNFITIDNMDKFTLSQSGYNVEAYEGRFMSLDKDAKEYLQDLNIDTDNLPKGRDFRPMTATCDYDHLSVSKDTRKRSALVKRRGSATSSRSGMRSGKKKFMNTAQPEFYNHPHSIKLLSKKFAQSVSPQQRKLDQERVISITRRKIGLWIRQNKYPVIDAFFEIISKELGKNVMRGIEVNPDLFAKCLYMLEIGIDEKSGIAMSQDIGKGQKITAMMFCDYMEGDDTDMVNKLRDVIYVNGLRFEDLMKTLNITNENALLDFFNMRDGIRRIDPSLTADQAKVLAAEILKGRDQITVYDLIEVLEGISEEEGPHQLHNNIMMLNQIRIKLLEHKNPNILREKFEKMDDNNNGLLDPASFKTCLLQLREALGLSIGQINRLGRYIPKKDGTFIDYNAFLKRLNTELIKLSLSQKNSLNKDSLFDIENLALDMKNYLKTQNINVRRFLVRALGNDDNVDDEELKYLNTNMQVTEFADYVCREIYSVSDVSDVTISYYINKIDIDKDGYIDAEDLRAFLDRFDLLEDKNDRLAETLYNSFQIDATQQLGIPLKKSLYPTKEIQASKVDAVLRDLRNGLGNRNISFREFFMRIDMNKDGLITYEEFKEGIRDIVEFSNPVLKGLFAYMDRQHIGMIDFSNYLKVMKKSVLDDLKEGAEDNFDWQIDVIKQIKNWFYSKELSSEDAFRLVDTDFDNEINKIDLRRFLETVLMIPEEEVTSPRLDRLFNLLDQYKRNRITYEDFRRLLADDFVPSDNISITGGLENDKHSFDWLLNARQKIGIYISKKYRDLKNCFEEVSSHSGRITYRQFKKWIEPRGILHGFNLTELLLRELFSDIDPHKKGHLTENDWLNAFGCFDHIKIYLAELKELIASNFATPGDAFVFFARHGPTRTAFNKSCFKRAVNTLIPKRFSSTDLEKIWYRLAGNSASMNRNTFNRYFSSIDFDGSLSLTGSKIQKSLFPGINNSTKNYTTKLKSIEPDKSDVISKMRQFIKASHKTIKQIFDEIDSNHFGVVTNLEFKQGIRKLLIGLTSKEIDDLINVVDMNRDGRVDWVEFNNRFKEHDTDWRILDRTRQRLHWIKDQIYLFMLSPKDAFRQFNTDRSGKMTFEHFENFIDSLCSMSAEKTPNFVVKKDLFQYFDSKKDGFIDLTEWQEVFKRIEVPIKSRHLQHIVLNPDGSDISKFEISHEFDNIIRVIARNRRFLVNQFRQMERRGIPINFKSVRAVFTKLLRGQCIDVPENCWPLLISFAEKDGFIDYKYLLDRYKERVSNLYSYPKVKGV